MVLADCFLIWISNVIITESTFICFSPIPLGIKIILVFYRVLLLPIQSQHSAILCFQNSKSNFCSFFLPSTCNLVGEWAYIIQMKLVLITVLFTHGSEELVAVLALLMGFCSLSIQTLHGEGAMSPFLACYLHSLANLKLSPLPITQD